jgi:two-component system, NarL family, response regulator NreC
MTVTVALIDDHLVFREAFRTLLASTPDFSVVAEAQEGQEVCPLYESKKPDVVVMDVTLPGTDGLTATRELTSRYPAKVLMLSAHAVQDYVSRAFAYGATGYALKSQPASAVMEAVKAVARGERYLAPELPVSLLTSTRVRGGRGAPGQLDGLSQREREVFDLVVRGYSNASISGALSISVKTVETHRANINRKLSVHSSTQLLRYAALRGLVSE